MKGEAWWRGSRYTSIVFYRDVGGLEITTREFFLGGPGRPLRFLLYRAASRNFLLRQSLHPRLYSTCEVAEVTSKLGAPSARLDAWSVVCCVIARLEVRQKVSAANLEDIKVVLLSGHDS